MKLSKTKINDLIDGDRRWLIKRDLASLYVDGPRLAIVYQVVG